MLDLIFWLILRHRLRPTATLPHKNLHWSETHGGAPMNWYASLSSSSAFNDPHIFSFDERASYP